MRLNLAEIASVLQCGREQILWSPPTMCSSEEEGREKACGTSLRSFRDIARMRSAPQPEIAFDALLSAMPWAESVPQGAEIDSRRLMPNMLFFCMPGEHVDGHDYALKAAEAGACAIIATRNPFPSGEKSGSGQSLPPVFLVADVKKALWKLAFCHRDTTLAKVVGITGSAGKTSVKEALGQTLAVHGRTERNPMNFNNQIGLPLSMLNASADASFWVMEVGISEAHDMDELGRILRPDCAIILNVGDAHTEGLGQGGVAYHKAKLLDYVQIGGMVIVSADYPELSAEVRQREALFASRNIDCVLFSITSSCSCCRTEYLGASTETAGRYKVNLGHEEYVLETPFRGDFGSENVAAVCTAAAKLGLTMDEIARGLSKVRLPDQRFNWRKIGEYILIDDSYNANLLSSVRMIEAAASMAEEEGIPLVLVMGEMRELGEKTEESHKTLGSAMAKAAPGVIFWKGDSAQWVREGLMSEGYQGAFYPVGGGQDFSLLLEELNLKHSVILFKGSRSNHLERLVDIFQSKVESAGECHAV